MGDIGYGEVMHVIVASLGGMLLERPLATEEAVDHIAFLALARASPTASQLNAMLNFCDRSTLLRKCQSLSVRAVESLLVYLSALSTV